MYNVLIVDGDAQFRSSLKYIVNWEMLGCKIGATAKNGEEAWKIYLQIQPDIVLLNITIDKLDGIELIRRMKIENTHSQIIVISEINKFECVKRSMKAGAFDYLLKKDLNKDDMKDVLQQVIRHLQESDQKNFKLDEQAFVKLQQCMVLKKNDHAVKELEFNEALRMEAFDPYRDNLQVAYFRIDNVKLVYQAYVLDHDKLHFSMEQIINDICNGYVKYRIIFISNHSGVILFGEHDKARIVDLCSTIIGNVSEMLQLHVSITLSDRIQDIHNFYYVYESLLELHEMRFYVGEGVLIQTVELHKFNELHYDALDFHVKMIDAIRRREFDEMTSLCEDTLMYMKENFIKPEYVRSFFIFILNNIEGNEIERGIKTSFPFEKILDRLSKCETIDKLSEVLDEAFFAIEQWIIDNQQNRYRQDIIEILGYIDQNYTKKINLKMIADKFNINESYLSRMFKNDTGKNVIQYINEKKMKRALQLLSDSSKTIKETAGAVGIDDQFYFNKVFKKYYNISPSAFRRKLKEKEDKIPS